MWDEEKKKDNRKARSEKNKRKWNFANEMFREKPKQPKRKKI